MKHIALAAALAFSALAGPAFAQAGHGHSELLSATSPADDQTVAAPRSISLTFAEPVTLQSVSLHNAAGPIALTFTPPTAPAAAYTIAVPQLAAGHYEVRWTAAHDGETAEGLFHFAVQ